MPSSKSRRAPAAAHQAAPTSGHPLSFCPTICRFSPPHSLWLGGLRIISVASAAWTSLVSFVPPGPYRRQAWLIFWLWTGRRVEGLPREGVHFSASSLSGRFCSAFGRKGELGILRLEMRRPEMTQIRTDDENDKEQVPFCDEELTSRWYCPGKWAA